MKAFLVCHSQRKAFQGFDNLLFEFYSAHGRLTRFLDWVVRHEIRTISGTLYCLHFR